MKRGVWPSPRSGRMKIGSRAVATGSQNQAALQDPIATAPGSDTVSELLGYFRTSAARTLSITAS